MPNFKVSAMVDGQIIGSVASLTPQVAKYTVTPKRADAPNERSGHGKFPFQVPRPHPKYITDPEKPNYGRHEAFKMQSISLKKRNKTKRFEYYLPEMKVIYKEPEELNKKRVPSVLLAQRRKKDFIEEANRSRSVVDAKIAKVHERAVSSTRETFAKKHGSIEKRKRRIVKSRQDMFATGREPMSYVELMASRARQRWNEGDAKKPKESAEQVIERMKQLGRYHTTYNRTMATNPGHDREVSKDY